MGIGGAYLCVYGMEGPGGYQFVGRTLQMWDRYRGVDAFNGKPWLLRFFDQIRFYPVSADELLSIRRDFPLGRYPLRIEQSELALSTYQDFLSREAEDIETFRVRQRAAFEAERERWRIAGQSVTDSVDVVLEAVDDAPIQAGQLGVESPISGNLWQVVTEVGKTVAEGETLMVLESMKMEIPIVSPQRGIIREIRCQPGASVRAGRCVVVMESQGKSCSVSWQAVK